MTQAPADCQLRVPGRTAADAGPADAGLMAALLVMVPWPELPEPEAPERHGFERPSRPGELRAAVSGARAGAPPPGRLGRWLAWAYGPDGPGHSEDPRVREQTDSWTLALWDQLSQESGGCAAAVPAALLARWLLAGLGRRAALAGRRIKAQVSLRAVAGLACLRVSWSFRAGSHRADRWAVLVAGPSWADRPAGSPWARLCCLPGP